MTMSTTTAVDSTGAEVHAYRPSSAARMRRRAPLLPALIFTIVVTQIPFVVTIGLLLWLYIKRHGVYRQMRNLLGATHRIEEVVVGRDHDGEEGEQGVEQAECLGAPVGGEAPEHQATPQCPPEVQAGHCRVLVGDGLGRR